MLAEDPWAAVCRLHVVGRGNGGVAHAVLHVGVVPHDGGVAEIDLVAGAGVLACHGAVEANAWVEVNRCAGRDANALGASVESGGWGARVLCDVVGIGLARGIDDGDEWIVGTPRARNASITLGADCGYEASHGREEVGRVHSG